MNKKIQFDTLKDFINTHNNCVFCNSKLKSIVTNYIATPYGLPFFKAPLDIDHFKCKIDYTTQQCRINTNILISINSNEIEFEDYVSYESVLYAFNQMSPHIELRCPNIKCKMTYCVSSSIFNISKEGECNYKIKPIFIFMETFVIDKWWVMNDPNNKTTSIYPIDNELASPIKLPLLNLSDVDNEKIINKIRTIVVFS